MNTKERTRCHTIIHASSIVAFSSFARPQDDAPTLDSIQLTMAVRLGLVFGIALDHNSAAALLADAAQNALNASGAAVLAETIGWLLVERFSGQAQAA